MRILIAIPTFENILPETFKSVYDLDTAGHDTDFEFVKGYDCAKARNMIAKMSDGYDYVLMVDSDVIVPHDALQNMLSPATDVVFGCCPRKNTTEGKTALYRVGNDYKHPYYYSELTEPRIKLLGGGFACVLIDTKVFTKLKYPYFKYVVYENGDCLSEDLYFSSQARKARFNLEADTRVRCGHLARSFQYE